tara:strand:- start:100740 stop:101651 length:912 start_codon:yes stop_codon:yes gene_type:complete
MLIADIGGTRSRFALAPQPGDIGDAVELPTGAKPLVATLEDALTALGATASAHDAAFAVAGAVEDGCADLTNAGWSFDAADIAATMGFQRVTVINDFQSIAAALPLLGEDGTVKIGGGEPDVSAPMLVLGPGTGLGVAASVLTEGGGRMELAGEGGHVTLAGRTGEEDAILVRMRTLYPHVSAERILSGPGLEIMHKVRTGEELSAAAIAAAAIAGEPTALSSVHVFTDFLATVASDAALTLGAKGGVYLAGGVLTGLGSAFEGKRFHKRFCDKGRFSDYLSVLPVYRVTHPQPGLLGLSARA